ncbi:hypothetical protein J6590_051585 [Homalodisca vitripennis]|nr:hypothetical protein J6590_051585 [Homalodisca vitripennis]
MKRVHETIKQKVTRLLRNKEISVPKPDMRAARRDRCLLVQTGKPQGLPGAVFLTDSSGLRLEYYRVPYSLQFIHSLLLHRTNVLQVIRTFAVPNHEIAYKLDILYRTGVANVWSQNCSQYIALGLNIKSIKLAGRNSQSESDALATITTISTEARSILKTEQQCPAPPPQLATHPHPPSLPQADNNSVPHGRPPSLGNTTA